MNIKDYDDIKVPKNLNEYIEKGISKGIDYENSTPLKNNKMFLSVAIASIILIITAANIPTYANELIKIPVIGKLVRVLDFRGSTEFGGVISDGNSMVVDSLNKDSINIYFTKNGNLIDNTPSYQIEYRQYPYTMVFTFSGVRDYDKTNIESKVKEIAYVEDVYELMVLDDSTRKIAIQFNENISFKLSELKNPAMIELKFKLNDIKDSNKSGYFLCSEDFEYKEELAIAEESLYHFAGVEVQKASNDKFVIQFGPFDNIDEANKKLNIIKSYEGAYSRFHIEERSTGEGPKAKH